MTVQVTPLGDRAIVLKQDDAAGAAGWKQMADLAWALEQQGEAWIIEIVPAYETVTVVYDSALLWREIEIGPEADSLLPYQLAERRLRLLIKNGRTAAERDVQGRRIDLPTYYGGEYGPDLEESAARAGMTASRFIEEHSKAEYTVAMIGFMPGFPYLSGLPEKLEQPRKPVPRAVVPAGSVGIAGKQTGVYPIATPGGWQIIGYTPIAMFNKERKDPVLLRAGDRIRFIPISGGEGSI
ncbi:5-oxoprolinase subunit PxpB [Paenibacillus glycanilyticus]|uniref:5-oxoprolinase subunit PxpB n=1 Tax=Paenibacillus glycanilyticus TaxID=126569 RepID=UPI00203CF957|nr:5-oxoprolinase subunit PxpB [Paenibacillus glycanilyticus]MCM3628946.1 5-oxoprolinase subunit PxpB [Paenibacillus glycanilyticus]